MNGVRIFSHFDDLPADTSPLFAAAEAESFFLGLPWFQTFERYALDKGDQVRIYSVVKSGPEGCRQVVLPTVVKTPNGSGTRSRKLNSLSSYYSSFYAPITDGLLSPELTRELAHAIAEESPSWDALEFRPLEVRSAAFEALVGALREAGFVVQTYFCFGNWYLDVQGRNFAEYLTSLPSVLRNTLNRKRKKLIKTFKTEIQIVTSEEGLQPALAAYRRVYNSSWKQPEPYPEFVPELIRRCAAAGMLRLGVLSIDGRPAASQFWLVHNKKALIYKLAYDEELAELSAGTILTAALMERVLDIDRVDEVDYLTGDDAYKRDWMSGRRERWGILAMNPRTVSGALAIARHVGGRALKNAAVALSRRVRRKSNPSLGARSGSEA